MINYMDDDICAILPTYEDGCGLVAKVYYNSGKILTDNKSIRSVIILMCKCAAVDRINQKKNILKFNPKLLPPLIINNRVFVKFKVLKPKARGDRTYGYFDFAHISWIRPEITGLAEIVFKNGKKLKINCKFETAAKHYIQYIQFVEEYVNGKAKSLEEL